MRKDRKVNMIRSLKNELSFYKRQLVKFHAFDKTELNHLRIQQVFSREEVMYITQMPKEVRASMFQRRIAKAVEDSIGEIPVETEFDEYSGTYRVSLDLWVKQKGF